MAAAHPSQNGTNRRRLRAQLPRIAVGVVGLGALAAAPVAAASLWLLLTDPMTAGEVVERGDLLPLARALAVAVGRALEAILAYL
jgi:hypothetical protein